MCLCAKSSHGQMSVKEISSKSKIQDNLHQNDVHLYEDEKGIWLFRGQNPIHIFSRLSIQYS